mmetsp:Transcript_4150/g.10060  ORF Transcript_4150/g.10060 Transcript_4150/m.10060 type:complete len:423 (-) Transcript_4150:202-1470(-)
MFAAPTKVLGANRSLHCVFDNGGALVARRCCHCCKAPGQERPRDAPPPLPLSCRGARPARRLLQGFTCRAAGKDRSAVAGVASGADEALVRLVLGDETELTMQELSRGFCNSVHLVTRPPGDEAIVVKLYSDLSLLRTEPNQRGVIDRSASEAGLGPLVLASVDEGIAHSFFQGRVLEEDDLHTRADVGEAVARLVADFHSLQVPPEFDANKPLLWKWLERMLDAISASNNVDALPDSVSLQALRREVDRMAAAVRSAEELGLLQTVLGHGDLKPTNIMLVSGESNPTVEVKLIDLELAGPNYRGFDLMKLFRTNSQTFSDERFTAFLSEYCKATTGLICSESMVSEIKAETQLFEPLTWLEAAVFFALVVSLGPNSGGPGASGGSSRWVELLEDRWEKYLAQRWMVEHHLGDLRRLRGRAN